MDDCILTPEIVKDAFGFDEVAFTLVGNRRATMKVSRLNETWEITAYLNIECGEWDFYSDAGRKIGSLTPT
jgi:hypothetical protein